MSSVWSDKARAVLVGAISLWISGAALAAGDTSVDVFASPTQELRNDPISSSHDVSSPKGLAKASADLRTGSVHVFAEGFEPATSPTQISAQALGRIVDRITIDGPFVGSVTGFITMHISGRLFPDVEHDRSWGSSAWMESRLSLSNTTFSSGQGYTIVSSTGCSTPSPGLVCEVGQIANRSLDVPFTVTAERPTFTMSMSMIAYTIEQGKADFWNTGYLTINLPSGYSYTSESGVFLTMAIPEPQIYSLFSAGLLVVAGACRRRAVRRSTDQSKLRAASLHLFARRAAPRGSHDSRGVLQYRDIHNSPTSALPRARHVPRSLARTSHSR